jgi:pSer/pThr/pTyr-binding forkhead associated (FHA) protein
MAALAESSSTKTAPVPRPTGLALEVRHDAQLVVQKALVTGCLAVGRGKNVGLHLDSRLVSRRHAATAERTMVEDLGSENGIRVNDQRCSAQWLVPGDTITLGDYTLTCIETPQHR